MENLTKEQAYSKMEESLLPVFKESVELCKYLNDDQNFFKEGYNQVKLLSMALVSLAIKEVNANSGTIDEKKEAIRDTDYWDGYFIKDGQRQIAGCYHDWKGIREFRDEICRATNIPVDDNYEILYLGAFKRDIGWWRKEPLISTSGDILDWSKMANSEVFEAVSRGGDFYYTKEDNVKRQEKIKEFCDLKINNMVRQKSLKESEALSKEIEEYVKSQDGIQRHYHFMCEEHVGGLEGSFFLEDFDKHHEQVASYLQRILKVSEGRELSEKEVQMACQILDTVIWDSYPPDDFLPVDDILTEGYKIEHKLINARAPFSELEKRLSEGLSDGQDREIIGAEIANFVSNNDIESLKYLQNNGVNLQYTCVKAYEYGKDNLFQYAETPEMVDFLAKAGCEINLPVGENGDISLLKDALKYERSKDVIEHMIKAGAEITDDFKEALQKELLMKRRSAGARGFDLDKDIYELERFIQKVDPTAFVEQRRKEIEKRLEEHKNGGVEAKVSGVVVNDELVKIRPSIGTVTPEKAKTLSPIIKEAILEKRKNKK